MEVKAERTEAVIQPDGSIEGRGYLSTVVEDYRSDRLILEDISAEVARLHRRLDALEPYLPLLHRWFAMRQALGKTLGGLRHG